MEKILKIELIEFRKVLPEYLLYSTFSENPEDLLILIEEYGLEDVD